MPETYRTVNELLKPLKIYLTQHLDDGSFFFQHKISNDILECVLCDHSICLFMKNINHVVYALLKTVHFRPITTISEIYNSIKNPYFGCKNLEEALIMKDLTVKTGQ